MRRVFAVVAVALVFFSTASSVLADEGGKTVVNPCYICTFTLGEGPTIPVCDANAGGSGGSCSMGCSSQGCTCSASGNCNITMLPNAISPAGTMRHVAALSRSGREGAFSLGCGGVVVAREYSEDQFIAIASSTHELRI